MTAIRAFFSNFRERAGETSSVPHLVMRFTKATSFECYLSSLARALFSLKVVLLFYLKFYIKQSWTWDSLLTSKMELFVSTSICKLILCRLIILYTQHCPMRVSLCYWFHSVLIGSTCKHLRGCFL